MFWRRWEVFTMTIIDGKKYTDISVMRVLDGLEI